MPELLPPAGRPSLTSLLLAPLAPATAAAREETRAAAALIPRTLADLALSRPGRTSLRLTDHDVRRARDPLGGPTPAPFAWSARTARRGLGLAATRLLVSGEARTPVEAVRRTTDTAVAAVRDGGALHTAMDRWLAGLAGPARSLVEAEAVTWSTRLWCALDWNAFPEPPVIGRDRWWDSPHSPLLALRGRAEVRSFVLDSHNEACSVHLVVLAGPRRTWVRDELAVVALVEMLHGAPSLSAGRVVGWWSDSGHRVAVEVDPSVLEAAVATVTRALAAGASPARPAAATAQAA